MIVKVIKDQWWSVFFFFFGFFFFLKGRETYPLCNHKNNYLWGLCLSIIGNFFCDRYLVVSCKRNYEEISNFHAYVCVCLWVYRYMKGEHERLQHPIAKLITSHHITSYTNCKRKCKESSDERLYPIKGKKKKSAKTLKFLKPK